MAKFDSYISHEGLSLEYEEALTRGPRTNVQPESSGSLSRSNSMLPRNRQGSTNPRSDATGSPQKFYNLSSHFIWIGDRTRQLDGAHVEYFRGIQNPIGIKIGPTMKPEELVQLLDGETGSAQPRVQRVKLMDDRLQWSTRTTYPERSP
jgi:3-deoxy-7-phosphoheptulonate synthase